MPRSGTTWISQILEAHPAIAVRFSPNYSYTFKNTLTIQSTAKDWINVLTASLTTADPFVTHEYRRTTGELPRFPKAPNDITRLCVKDTRFHELYLGGLSVLPKAQLVYVVRDPCATLYSWSKCKEFPAHTPLVDGWRNGAGRKEEGPGEYWGFDDWKRLTAMYDRLAETTPEQVYIVSYEAMVACAVDEAMRLLRFARLPWNEEIDRFIARSQQSHAESPYSVFKTPRHSERWRSSFPPSILRAVLDEVAGTRLERYLFSPSPNSRR